MACHQHRLSSIYFGERRYDQQTTHESQMINRHVNWVAEGPIWRSSRIRVKAGTAILMDTKETRPPGDMRIVMVILGWVGKLKGFVFISILCHLLPKRIIVRNTFGQWWWLEWILTSSKLLSFTALTSPLFPHLAWFWPPRLHLKV